MVLQYPYIIYGTTSGFTAGNSVILFNERTGDQLTTTLNSLGQYIFDCANFSSGWANEDLLRIKVDVSFTANGKVLKFKAEANSTARINNLIIKYET